VDSFEFLKLTLDPQRLAVLGLLAIGEHSTDELAAATGQRPRQVLGVVGTLMTEGLAVERDGRYLLDPEQLRLLAGELPSAPETDQRLLYGMTEDERSVLTRFFRGTRLTEIPTTRAKRRVVLERLALELEPGVYYPEPEVNDMLSMFHDDYAALRRYLVDEGLLTREQGRYWRSGGRVS
jgi:hypothetical protein